MTSKRDAAVDLAKQGLRVFPLVPNGKTPALEGNWRKVASSDPIRVAEMWTCPVMEAELDYNIGIAVPSTEIYVDIDKRNGKRGFESLKLLEAIYETLPDTFTVDTPSGGEHRRYTCEDSSVFAKVLATDIDLKGDGGYVVAPGSTIDGRAYRARNEGQRAVARLPEWVREHAPAGRRKNRDQLEELATVDPSFSLDQPDAVRRATRYLETTAPDHGTFKVAARVKDFGVSRETCCSLIVAHWPGAEGKSLEHIEFRVANAYSYGQNPVGISSPEAEFEAVEIDATKPPPRPKGLYAIRWKDAQPDLEQQYLIDDVMDLGAMVVTYGDSNVGKTYVKLDQCFHIAAGKDWNGHKVKQGLVVYVAAEGGKGFLKRMQAFKIHYGVTDLPFSLVPCPIDLQSDAADTGKLVKLIREEEAHFGQKCVLVVIDTLARAMAGGDENTAVDMSKFVGHSDRLRAATGATVDVIHHTGKDKAKGARGSSALRAATDTELEIDEGTFEAKKQRDMARGDVLRFELVNVEVGHRSDGKLITACVIRWIAASEFSTEMSPMAAQALDCLRKLLDAKRDEIEENENIDKSNLLGDVKVPWEEWQLLGMSVILGPRGKPLKRTALYPLRQELSDLGKVKKDKSNQWYIV